ncbi:hypothetical protein BKA63DRAFT_513299 [Paraphoma chrysanthemicola]|nr:hypothetical protein BKA63DRAFT_513299 [Paraphoma chrysanthemicola]
MAAGMAFSEVDTAMSEEFDRLRWSVFEDLSTIQVANESESIEPELSSFLGHPIASEPATEDPLHEIAFCSDDLQNFEAADFEAPEPLLVRRADGGIVTIGDVVEQLSRYFVKAQRQDTRSQKSVSPVHSRSDGRRRASRWNSCLRGRTRASRHQSRL